MNTIRQIRTSLQLTQTEFGRQFGGIPLRTVQRWENGESEPPAYIVWMITEIAKEKARD